MLYLSRTALLLASLALAACNGSVHVSGSPHPPPTPVYFETEPNDSVFDADFVSTVVGSQRIIVRGNLQAEYGDIDGFAFVAAEPVSIDFVLDEYDLFGDLALCIYDPLLDQYIACYDSILDEKGSFEVLQPGREFQLVIYSEHFDCGSSYELDLFISRLGYGLETTAGSDSAASTDGRAVLPRPARSEPPVVPSGVDGYTRTRRTAPRATQGSTEVLGQGLWLRLEPSGEISDLRPGVLVRQR
ncbi:MAG: hypothetical protein ACI8QZ_002173 [Chlamydiales bacterium]|jgi:hypothetical protein